MTYQQFRTENPEPDDFGFQENLCVGWVLWGTTKTLCYRYSGVIKHIMDNSEMDEDMAEEYFEVNVLGMYFKDRQPCFLLDNLPHPNIIRFGGKRKPHNHLHLWQTT